MKKLIQEQLPQQQRTLEEFNSLMTAYHYSFTPIRVIHCPQAYGVVIQNQQYMVSYSGDTRPSEPFRKAAHGSDLLIHETTFNDHEQNKAFSYLHSTVQEAVNEYWRSDLGD